MHDRASSQALDDRETSEAIYNAALNPMLLAEGIYVKVTVEGEPDRFHRDNGMPVPANKGGAEVRWRRFGEI